MSTRSYICKELPNGKYKTIYCHFDGYVDHNGLFLNDIYNTEKKVDELINLGNLSTLGLVIKPSKKKNILLKIHKDMFVLPMVEIETKKIRKQKNLPLKTCLKTTG